MPPEQEKLLPAMAGVIARDRLTRGGRLNYPEAVAILSRWVIEHARQGHASVEQLMDEGRCVLPRQQLMDGVPEMADGLPLIEELETAVAEQEERLAIGNVASFIKADREFHRIFVRAAENAILLQRHDSPRDRQDRMGLVALAGDARRTRQIVDEHCEIVELVSAARHEETVAALERRLHGTLELLLRQTPALRG